MEEMSQSQSQELQYSLNEVVWAKITGFPWWPAHITALPSHTNINFRVDFFADTTHAFVSSSKIAKYQDLRHRMESNKPMKKDLRKAITLADHQFNDLWGHSARPRVCKWADEPAVAKQVQLCELPLNKQIQLQENNQQIQDQHIQIVENTPPHSPQQIIDREHYVQQLLLKYNLHNLDAQSNDKIHRPERSRHRRLYVSKKNKSKLKRIAKVQQIKQSAAFLLSKRLYRLLLAKPNLRQDQRRAICLNLCKQIEVHNRAHIEKSGEQVLRLLKWISISSSSIITSYYQSWSCLQIKENGSHMTTETEE